METEGDGSGRGRRERLHHCEGEETGGQVPDQVRNVEVLLPAGVRPAWSHSRPSAGGGHAGTRRLRLITNSI